MEIDWPAEFGSWLEGLETRAANGDECADLLLDFATAELKYLRELLESPVKPAVGGEANEPSGPVFVRGNKHLARLLSDPERAARVEKIRADTHEMNRVYAMNLAMIRKSVELTQVEMAKRLGTDQGSVSRMENREDMLLSTLADYLMATGADSAAIVVNVHGREYALDLDRFRSRERA